MTGKRNGTIQARALKLVFALALAISWPPPAHAAGPAEAPLPDPAAEARAQALAREIRCVVCENEPVALSSAEIARDMRMAIRTRIAAGDSDAQVRDWFARRYGDFVLLRPPARPETLILWAGPFVLVAGAGLWLAGAAARRRGAGALPVAEIPGSDGDAAARAALARLEADGQPGDAGGARPPG